MDVEVAPVAPRGRSGGPRGPVVALVVLVVVVAGSIALAQAFPPDEPVSGSPVAVTPPAVALESGVPSGVPTGQPDTTAPSPPTLDGSPGFAARVGRQALVAGVLDGTLDGWLVFADAELRSDCVTGTGASCTALAPRIVGLPLGLVREAAGDPAGYVPHGAVLVLRVVGRGLEYEGSLLTHPDGAPRLAQLDVELGDAPAADRTSTLHDAGGWLMLDGPCTIPPSAFQPCPRLAMIADAEPVPTARRRADAGRPVAVPLGAWGIDDAGSSVLEGPFLVRRNPAALADDDAPAWEVIARYDPSRSVRVVIP